jgi:hypothetical protein
MIYFNLNEINLLFIIRVSHIENINMTTINHGWDHELEHRLVS